MTKAKVTFPSAPDTSAIDIKDEGSLIVSNPTAMNFTGPGVTVTENPTGTAEVDIPGLQYWTESEDATTQQSTIFTPNNSATDVNAVIQPKGNGANTAQTPDGTAAGGNARGAYATDWQKRRLNANQVASGAESVICGGLDNIASGNQSFVGGGVDNSAGGAESSVLGGNNNSSGGNYSTVIGGSGCSSSGQYSLSGITSDATNTAAMSIGASSLASGSYSMTLGGQDNRATANNSLGLGSQNQVQSVYSYLNGSGGLNKNPNTKIWAAGYRATGNISPLSFSGRTQEGVTILGFNTRYQPFGAPEAVKASAETINLSPGSGNGTGTTSWIPAKDNQHFTFQIKLLATVLAINGTATGINVGDVKQWNFEGSGKIVSGTLTILNAGTTPTVLYEDSGLATMSAQFLASGSNVLAQVTNATFIGGGTLSLLISGFLYFQETSLD